MTVLSDAEFYLPNTTTTVLTKGVGNVTSGRATNKNVFDNEGKLITIKNNGRTFCGARCVQNSIFTDVTMWTRNTNMVVTPGQSDPDGGTSAYKLTASLAGADVGMSILPMLTITKYYFIFWLKRITGAGDIIIFSDGSPIVLSGVTTSWQRFVVPDNNNIVAINNIIKLATAGDEVTVWHAQDEYHDPDQLEYVSNGILSSPWHGGGADGVKFFATNKDGLAISDATLLGDHVDSASKTNTLLWCRDFTNAVWVKTNITAAKNQTGITRQANSCSLLICSSAGGTILQTITAAAASGCSGFWVKRGVGTGTVEITRDNGSTWTDVTSLINSSTFSVVKIENTSVTNPIVGIRMGTTNDTIIVDGGLNHLGTQLCEPIFTESAAVTRNADIVTYQTAGNFSDTAGTILATIRRENWANNNGSVVGSATRGLYTSASNSGAQGVDGTNTVNGPAGSIITQRKIGLKYSGSSLKVFAGGNFGAPGSYDGSFNLSTIAIMPGTNGYVRDVSIWQSSLSDADMISAASFQTDTAAAGAGTATIANNYINSISVTASGVGGGTFANNYIHNVDASASGVGLAAITNNYIHSISANADGVGSLSAEAIRVRNLMAQQTIRITYYQPTITISI